jgi:hypothetical protein
MTNMAATTTETTQTSTAMVAPKAPTTPEEAAFALLQRRAKVLASGTIGIPTEYQNNLPNVLVAMELAERIGASVVAVMQNLHIIHGRPGWSSSFLIATVNACGRFSPLRFRFEGKAGTDEWGCRAYAKDRESGEECLGSLITIGMAKAEGWATKSGSKWKTMPEQMLMYRAAAFWTRAYAPELSLGMQTSDEVRDVHGLHDIDITESVVPKSPKELEAALLAPKSQTPTDGVAAVEAVPEPTKSEPKVDAKPARKAKADAGVVPESNLFKDDPQPAREPGEEG